MARTTSILLVLLALIAASCSTENETLTSAGVSDAGIEDDEASQNDAVADDSAPEELVDVSPTTTAPWEAVSYTHLTLPTILRV